MKTKILAVVVLAMGFVASGAYAGSFSVHVGSGHKHHGYRHHHKTHHKKWSPRHHFYRGWHRPFIIVKKKPVVVKTVSYAEACGEKIPYGYLRSGRVQSPWSGFTMSAGGKSSGEIVYDPNTGQAFRIP